MNFVTLQSNAQQKLRESWCKFQSKVLPLLILLKRGKYHTTSDHTLQLLRMVSEMLAVLKREVERVDEVVY